MSIRYLKDVFPATVFLNRPVTGSRGHDVTGYGRKIRTDHMARFSNRLHRVYVICYSNAGSTYVLHKGESLFIRDFDIPKDECEAAAVRTKDRTLGAVKENRA